MKTALVVHGGQGVGKNMFFEAVMGIYGEYGRVIGQSELEEKFNEWASRKLFLIANEVIARQELFHQKNKIKALITDDWIHINQKNVAAHDERNHLNLVFLSNESQPVILDPDDRRFMAIWTPKKHDASFYHDVLQEIAGGGIAALHQYLLDYDLGDFHPGTPPLDTRARVSLIEISKESPDRFIDAWLAGELGVEPATCSLADLYLFYTRWCRDEGERFSYAKNKFSAHIGRREDIDVAKKGVLQGNGKSKVTNVVILECDPKPDGPAWLEWLGNKVKSFSLALSNVEGGF
jgi:putative DNA primase/helicase